MCSLIIVFLFFLIKPPQIYNTHKLPQTPIHIACDTDGVRVNLAAVAVSALGSWNPSVIMLMEVA